MDWVTPQDEPELLAWGDELEVRLSEMAPGLSPGRRAPLVAALALYCARDRGQAPLSEAELDMLILHGLRHAGETGAAEAAIARWPALRRRRVEAYDALGRTVRSSAALAGRMIAKGCLYPSEVWTDAGMVWTLSLDRWIRPEDLLMELAWTARVHEVLDAMAALWEHSSGRGRLRIRGLMTLARWMEGDRAPSRCVRRRAEQLRVWIEERWVRLASMKGWRETPGIVPLDLVV